MTDKSARIAILDLLRKARHADSMLRELGMLDPEVSVVIGVDADVWALFTDADGPAKEYATFVSRRLSESPDTMFEITAFKKEVEEA